MKISISELKSERQWRSATGYNQERFNKLLVNFESIYEKLYQGSMEEIKSKIPMENVIKNCEELLFFTLSRGLVPEASLGLLVSNLAKPIMFLVM